MTPPAVRGARRFAPPVLAALLAGCGGGGDTSPGAAGETVGVVEELRVGGLDGPEELTFGYVYALAPTPDGGFYAFDAMIPRIRRYDPQGRWMGDVGRGGEGPGEYRQVTGMRVLPDGRLAVWDPGNRRVSYYDPEGEVVGSWLASEAMGSSALALDDQGGLYTWAADPDAGMVESADGIQGFWARFDPDGTVERLVRFPPEESVGPYYVLSGRGGYYRPFNVMTLNTMGADGSYYEVRNDAYRIRHLHPDGTETFIVREEPRVRLTPEERAEWTAYSESFAERTPEMRDRFFPIPEVKPYIRHLLVDVEGRLWVSRYTRAVHLPYSPEEAADRAEEGLNSYTWRDEPLWDVFSPDDEYLWSVTLPFKTTLVEASGDTVWGIQGGSFREDYVVRFRLER